MAGCRLDADGGGTPARHPGRSEHSARLLLATLIALCALLAAACGSDGGSTTSASSVTTRATASGEGAGSGPGSPAPQPLAKKEKVVLVYSAPIEAWANVLLAQQFGEFEAENLDVQIQTIPGPDGSVLVAQGKADVQTAGVSAGILNAIAGGQPVRYVASTYVEDAPLAGFWIDNKYMNDGKPDAEKLKGTRVVPGIGGGGFGNPGALPLWNWMQEVGLGANDFQLIDVTSPQDAAMAIQNGTASISIGLTPQWASIEDSGCCSFFIPTVVSGSFLVNQKFMQERPEVAQAFFRAIMRTNRTYLQGDYHQDQKVVAALASQTKVPAETIAAQPPLGFSADLELATVDVLPDFQAQFRAFDLLSYDQDLKVDQMIDTSPVDAVLQGG